MGLGFVIIFLSLGINNNVFGLGLYFFLNLGLTKLGLGLSSIFCFVVGNNGDGPPLNLFFLGVVAISQLCNYDYLSMLHRTGAKSHKCTSS